LEWLEIYKLLAPLLSALFRYPTVEVVFRVLPFARVKAIL